MKVVLQRVAWARVEVDQQTIGAIERGILGLLAVEKSDCEADAERLTQRILNYRIFPDESGRMNLSLLDIQGGLLLVPQFTVAADTRKGNRPSFTPAADPELGLRLYLHALQSAKRKLSDVGRGEFGADMQVSLCNDGPVTFLLET